MRIAVALCLGLNACVPHNCRCGAQVVATGTHGLVCKRAVGRIARHQGLNDIIARAFAITGTPTTNEPNGLSFRRKATWWSYFCAMGAKANHSPVICTSASSYLAAASQTAGSAVKLGAGRKEDKYSCSANTHTFEPIAFETLGPMNSTATTLLCDLGRRATARTNEIRETSFLFQRLSLNIQRFNSASIHESFICTDHQISDHSSIIFNFSFKPSGIKVPRANEENNTNSPQQRPSFLAA